MLKTASDKPTAFTEGELKRRKKQARQEAKLMLELKEAKRISRRLRRNRRKHRRGWRRKAPLYKHLKHIWRNFAPQARDLPLPRLHKAQSLSTSQPSW